jgi:hypothetical protein
MVLASHASPYMKHETSDMKREEFSSFKVDVSRLHLTEQLWPRMLSP